ncbi:AAA family ATPase [Marinobacterium aestuariivivens]|uniref:AAA family ATPase n=1 Tax=Marinobacterium aestuariivivens TaxID=1698799 RepID=A0ABW1ZZ86_9GAMM
MLPTAQHSDHYPLQQLIRELLALLLLQPVERGRLGAAVDDYQRRFGPLPGLPELAGLATDGQTPGAESPSQHAALETLLNQLSPSAPLLITIEDIHWADAATMAALTALARAGAGCPLLLVLTSRFEGHPFSPHWRSSLGELPLLTLDLTPLRTDDTQQLIRALGLDPDSEMAQRCQQRAGGNPLFLEQLLCFGEGQTGSELPLRIASLVAARVDSLDAPARRLVRLAAVLGQQFGSEDLLTLGDAEPALIERLIQQRLLRLRDGQLQFAHALLQESLYAQLGRQERQEAHYRAARFYAGRSRVREAEHLIHAGDAQAVPRTLEAIAQLLEHQHPQRALWFCEQVLPLAVDEERWALHQQQAEALTRLGRIDEAIAAFDQAISLSDEPARQVDSWLGIANAQTIQDQFDEALQSLDHAARLSDGLSCQQQARLHITRGRILFTLGRQEDCLDASLRAQEQARRCDDPRWRVRALSGVGDGYYMLGQMGQACDHFRRAIEEALTRDLLSEAVNNYAMVATCQLYQLDTGAALQSLATAERLSKRRPEPRSGMLLLSLQGLLHHFARRDRGAARDCFSASLHLARQLGARRFIVDGHAQLAYMAQQEGDRSGFEQHIAAADASLEPGARHFVQPWLRAIEAMGQTDAATRHERMAQALALLTPECLPHCHLHVHQLQIDLALADQDLAALREGCDALLAYARGRDLRWAHFYADRALALAEGRIDAGRLEQELRQTGLLHCLSWLR